jgi:recombination protein RecA
MHAVRDVRAADGACASNRAEIGAGDWSTRWDARVDRVPPPFSLPAGRLVELVGSEGIAACTTVALCVVAHVQRIGEPAAWIQPEGGGFFPPDAAEAGVDLDALVVVHVPVPIAPARSTGSARTTAPARRDGDGRRPDLPSAQAAGQVRAAELLLRSGGFGAVVLDLRGSVPAGEAWQSRLAGLARQHECYVIVITEESKVRAPMGPQVAVRLRPTRRRKPEGIYCLEVEVLRNKSTHPVQPEPRCWRAPRGAS